MSSKSSKYTYKPCCYCGQVVAHAKDGRTLHMHRWSNKCKLAEKKRGQRGKG